MSTVMLVTGIAPDYLLFLLCRIGIGISWNIFQPVGIAVVGDTVHDHHIPQLTGIVEQSWALAGLLGIPMIGLMLNRLDWTLTYVILGCVMFVIDLLLLWRWWGSPDGDKDVEKASVVPNGTTTKQQDESEEKPENSEPELSPWGTLKNGFSVVMSQPVANWTFFLLIIHGGSYNAVFAAFGSWLVDDYKLDVEQIGLVVLAIGIGEVLGALCVSLFGAKIGRHETVFWGLVASLVSAVIIIIVAPIMNVWAAGFSIAFTFFVAEFCIVGMIAWGADLVPENSGTMMALFFASMALGRTWSALIADPVYSTFGIYGIAVLSIIVLIICILLLQFPVRIEMKKRQERVAQLKADVKVVQANKDINSIPLKVIEQPERSSIDIELEEEERKQEQNEKEDQNDDQNDDEKDDEKDDENDDDSVKDTKSIDEITA
eukprot:TRINITY_DN1172_c0_g1_i3.p1 TRINITY_DN1172_c0_g1~~TRINITY_DN1172_c0_g1_i3.p1  ORF type:complete len:431 (-),score=147.98 TRINITY_DN1172_c0_g1_i3:58-1350(-)